MSLERAVHGVRHGIDKLDVGVHAGDFGSDGSLAIRSGNWSDYETRLDVLDHLSGDKYVFNTDDHTLYMKVTVALLGTPTTDLVPIAVLDEGVDSLSAADLI